MFIPNPTNSPRRLDEEEPENEEGENCEGDVEEKESPRSEEVSEEG